ncbi:glycosyltransferase family 2 protein, partial [Candidatus Avelusimicrobium alvi]|uniref:glycosyltransferase family 2 protein n=1 Tax=Candidatus Avelusimicrobium alvi TaxID=3416221 RepID=UPI003D127D10
MKIALLVPMYNEEDSLPLFWEETQTVLQTLPDAQFEYVFVNDGSTDGTLAQLKELAQKNPNVKVISLARNFGKEAALTAGLLEAAKADAVIVLDADLQDPPSLIPAFMEKFKQGFDVVYGRRESRRKDSFLKRFTARGFYKFHNAIADRPLLLLIPVMTG